MFRLINLSVVILVIEMLQISTLGKKNLEELFYPIRLPGRPPFNPKQRNKIITGHANHKRMYLETLLTKEKVPHQVSIFHSSILTKQKAIPEDKTMPFQDITLDTKVSDDDRSNQNKNSNRIAVFDSTISEDEESKKIPDQGLTIETDDDHLNQNKNPNDTSVFEPLIPASHDEEQNHRKLFVQGLTIGSIPRGNDQANPKQELHRISVFDASNQEKQDEASKLIPLQGLTIPMKNINEMNQDKDYLRVSIFHTSSLQKNKKHNFKERAENESEENENEEEQNETEENENREQKFIPNTTFRGNAQRNQNKGLHRISVFDSNILSKDSDEHETNLRDTMHSATHLPYRRNELHRISVFDSTSLYPEYAPAIDQTLLGDRNSEENANTGLKRIPILDSTLPSYGKYQSYLFDEDLLRHVVVDKSVESKNKDQKYLNKELYNMTIQEKTLKKKLNRSKFEFDFATILQYGDDLAHIGDDSSVADKLTRNVRILCWVMTYPANHDTKARSVKATWGKRCNTLLFMSTGEDSSLPTVKLPVTEDYDHLWGKTKAAFRYIHKHHLNDAEWFLKADDDTYVIVENLRYMLASYNRFDPIYFGFRYKASYIKQGYASGGAGYVLSREAVDRFVKKALPSSKLCKQDDTGAEDAEMGICLENIGVKLMDSRDSYKRNRFFPFLPQDHVDASVDPSYWFWKMVYYPMELGRNCCSEYAVSFHYVDVPYMYALDYFAYHLRPYGISFNFETFYD